MTILLLISIFIIFKCVSSVCASSPWEKNPNWSQHHYLNHENIGPSKAYNSINPLRYEPWINDEYSNNENLDSYHFFEGLGNLSNLGRLEDLLQNNVREGNENCVMPPNRGFSRQYDPQRSYNNQKSDHTLSSEDLNAKSTSLNNTSREEDKDITGFDEAQGGTIQAVDGHDAPSSRSVRTRKSSECPSWKEGILKKTMIAYQNYAEEMKISYHRARIEINAVANTALTLKLLDEDGTERRKGAFAISQIFQRDHDDGKIQTQEYKPRPMSQARSSLSRKILAATIKAVAKQSKKAPRTAEIMVKRWLGSKIEEMLKDPQRFHQGVDAICKAHFDQVGPRKQYVVENRRYK